MPKRSLPKRSLSEQLDQAVQAMLVRPGAGKLRSDRSLTPLLRIAEELRDLPRESFKARLKSDLERKSSMASLAETATATRQTVTARLRVRNAAAAIEFYKNAFGAREIMRFAVHGSIAHAEIAIGNSIITLGDEAPDYGYPGPQDLGGSPVGIQLDVEDADAAAEQAVAAGGRLVAPVTDQFYGERSGQVADPFGYTWTLGTHKEDMSLAEMHRRFELMEQQKKKPTGDPARQGFHTVTPYLVAQNAAGLIEFVKAVFAAEETFRDIGSAGGFHCEVRVGDSMMMIGGGGPGLAWRGDAIPMASHIYVDDTDAAYRRALEAGAVSLQEPVDQPWGERTANVRDQFGNNWYLAKLLGAGHGMPTVQPYLHPLRSEPVIHFLKRAFGAEELGRYTTPDGVIHHTTVRIGSSTVEMGDAAGPYQPMPSMFYMYVPDVDATYRRAMQAGASSIAEPADQPYGDRVAAAKDVFGNQWYIATHMGQVKA